MSKAYYNEIDPYAAAWLRNLIAAGLIPDGDVDERSIVDVQPGDLAGYTQVHLFAGIGGWALAARMAGWPDDRELWTGSCPCQPFSAAGRQKGTEDERHLWPEYLRLIDARWPAVVMGEQVASQAGRDWLDGVLADLEGISYEGRAIVIPACAVDAPHRRERMWFVADGYGLVGDAAAQGLPGQSQRLLGTGGQGHAPWNTYGTIECLDGKHRRVEPGTFPLADGVSERVGRLSAYGNAIVPEIAAQVIGAYMDVT